MDNDEFLSLQELFKLSTRLNGQINVINRFTDSAAGTDLNQIKSDFRDLSGVFEDVSIPSMAVLLVDLVKAFEDYQVHLEDEFERL